MEWDENFYSPEPRSKMTGFIPEKLYHIVERDPLTEESKIVSELASRILELKEVNPRKPIVLLNVLARISRLSPSALWIVLEILAGGRDLEKSLSQKGKDLSFSKQAVHQKRNRDLEKLDTILPDIAEALKQIMTTKP